MAFHVAHIDDLERIAIGEMIYRPVRRPLGVTAFGANAYTADEAGGGLIEPQDGATARPAFPGEAHQAAGRQPAFGGGGHGARRPGRTPGAGPPRAHRPAAPK